MRNNLREVAELTKKSVFTFDPRGNLHVQDAAIFWTNFKGAMNNFGSNKRVFQLSLPKDVADLLLENGWNVYCMEPRNEGDETIYKTEIVVNIDSEYPPEIYVYSEFNGKRSRTQISDSDTLALLDDKNLTAINLTIRPFVHGRGKYTTKGYLLKMQAIEEEHYESDRYAAYLNGEDIFPEE